MHPDKWTNTVNNIKDKFEVTDQGDLSIDEEGGINIKYIEFESPMGQMRMEFVTRPVILDKKTNYSKRIGSETQVDYVYSETEKSHQLLVYKWSESDDDWKEVDGSMFQ